MTKDAQLEERISKIRLQPNLRYSDIRAIFEWKVGSKSKDHRTLAIPRSNTVIDLNAAAKITCGNKKAIRSSEVEPTIKQYVDLPGVGLVYAITLLHFASSGRYPIYDKFAHLGLLAYHNAIPVGAIISDGCYRKFWRSTKTGWTIIELIAICLTTVSACAGVRMTRESIKPYGPTVTYLTRIAVI